MIIECPNCNKKFNLDEKLIPENGRTLKCSSCAHVWHHKIVLNENKKDQNIAEDKNTKLDIDLTKIDKTDDKMKEKISYENTSDISDENISDRNIEYNDVETEDVKTDDKNAIKLKMIFIYFIILVISLLGLLFLLDTFKYNLSNIFPDIVPMLDSFYETFLDLKLFFKDLTK